MTLIGNRPDWVAAMCACFRLGAVVLPCTEQLRAKDLRLRLAAARPSLVIADERNRTELEAASPQCAVVLDPDETLFAAEPAVAIELGDGDPCLITFTSGTSGVPKAVVHGQRYLSGQLLQSQHWLDARAGELVWCTAASGWSKSARNVFIAPWLSGACALLHDARFDPHERLELMASRAGEHPVHGADRVPRHRQAGDARAAAGPARDGGRRRGAQPGGAARLQGGTGLEIRDGYGQTETGQMTGTRPGETARPGSMGRALPGVALSVEQDELIADPLSVPTFFLGYLGEGVERRDGRDLEDR